MPGSSRFFLFFASLSALSPEYLRSAVFLSRPPHFLPSSRFSSLRRLLPSPEPVLPSSLRSLSPRPNLLRSPSSRPNLRLPSPLPKLRPSPSPLPDRPLSPKRLPRFVYSSAAISSPLSPTCNFSMAAASSSASQPSSSIFRCKKLFISSMSSCSCSSHALFRYLSAFAFSTFAAPGSFFSVMVVWQTLSISRIL